MINIDEAAIVSVEKSLAEAFATGKTTRGCKIDMPVPTPPSLRKAANLALNLMVMELLNVHDVASSSAVAHVSIDFDKPVVKNG